MSAAPLCLVPTGFGINCEAETAHAFELAGGRVETPHLSDLAAQPERLASARILAFAGGFSFGDHLGAGRALAMRVRTRLGAALERFVADGGLVIGICNGFQTMVRLGLLPAGHIGEQSVTLAENHHGAFYDGWVTLAFDAASPCVWTRGLERMDVPVRHGEGRLICSPAARARVESEHLAPCRYLDPESGRAAERFPHNPNGSEGGLAGLCDPSGRIFGLMPHPEAFLYAENHPAWRRGGANSPRGLEIFRRGIEAARAGA
ncbi:MAG: phosphoribosylformylglycinamidine synthase subunit PurQ [Myxococcales bacterium]|nr:phosphoribosylformylglycinamidine synthase subunit PurQ [Myxococcales bacterium]